VSVGTDITELKLREAELAASERNFRDLLEQSIQGIFIRRGEEIVFANQAYADLFGYGSPDEIIGLDTVRQLKAPEERNRMQDYAKDRQTGQGAPNQYEFRGRRKDGSLIWIENRVQNVDWDGIEAVLTVSMDISVRIEAERRVDRAHALLRDAIESLSEGFLLYDADDRLVLTNKRALEMYKDVAHLYVPGAHFDDIVRGTAESGLIADAVGREDDWVRERIAQHNGPNQRFERRLGSDTWLMIAERQTDDGGSVVVAADITELKRHETELAEAKAQLEAVLDNIGQGVAMYDAEHRLVFRNRQWHQLQGYPAYLGEAGTSIETILGWAADHHHWRDMDGPDPVARTLSLFQSTTPEKFERVRADGMIAAVAVNPVADGTMVATIADITERKEHEVKLAEATARLQAVLDNIGQGVAMYDAEHRLVFRNRQWHRLNGYPDHLGEVGTSIETILEWAADHHHWRGMDGPDPVAKVLSPFHSRTPEHIERLRADGMIGAIEMNPVADGTLVATIADITERKRAEQALQTLNEELEQRVAERTAELSNAQDELVRKERLATLGQLTATVSHELRNPLGVLRNSAYVLRRAINEPDSRSDRAIDRIDRNITRCDRIIDELLDFTRSRRPELHPVVLDDWLGGVLDEQPEPRDIIVDREFGLPAAWFPLDRDLLHRAVVNLYDNACQALEDGESADPRITIETRKSVNRIEITVGDNGPGMASEVREKIFEPLYSTKGFGIGLGLPIVHRIMAQLDGGIELDSAPGRGTRAVLWLPDRSQ
jgi:PAS domain S-box-containing protein